MAWGTIRLPRGEMVGYCIPAVCAFEGCGAEIDKGLSYVCGGMHEGGEHGCGRYFCEKHLEMAIDAVTDVFIEDGGQLCKACCEKLEAEYRRAKEERRA